MKLFDVVNFDIMHMAKLGFIPTVCEFVNKVSSFSPLLAIGEQGQPTIRIINAEQVPEGANTVVTTNLEDIHDAPVRLIKFNRHLNLVVSTDQAGYIEIWDPESHEMPESDGRLGFDLMSDTDYLDLTAKETYALAMELSSDGKLLVIYGKD